MSLQNISTLKGSSSGSAADSQSN